MIRRNVITCSLVCISVVCTVACGSDRSTGAPSSGAAPTIEPATEQFSAEVARAPGPRLAPLTGLPISDEDPSPYRRPLAVMIDNIIDATPQSGLDKADVVIEALVEGGITRFMALYQSRDAEVIEPVRSARTPFLHWVMEYDAIYTHVGSSTLEGPANAGQQIEEWNIADLDLNTEVGPWFSVKPYDRNPARRAPHNVLTSSQRLRSEAAARGYENETAVSAWQFHPEAASLAPGTPAGSFNVRFGALSPRFVVRWDWDAGSGSYLRSQFGAPQFDAFSGARLASPNVVVQYAAAEVVSSKGHVLIEVVGEGRAQVFRSGEVVEAVWRKSDSGPRTRFYALDGSELSFVPGPTWIEVVDLSGGATVF